MLNQRITRAEFLKRGLLGILALLATPLLKLFGTRGNVSQKDAKYYKDLAG